MSTFTELAELSGKNHDELESYSKTVYEAVLESGFRHLEEVGRLSTWDKVVSANASMDF